jgi:hypothetical protein
VADLELLTLNLKTMSKEKTKVQESTNPPLLIADVSSSLPPDVAEKILKARDAFVERDYDEVWHWLYSIASPNYDKTEPWEDLERMAGRL